MAVRRLGSITKKMQSLPEYTFRKEYAEFGFEIRTLKYFLEQNKSNDKEQVHRLKFYAVIFIAHGKGSHVINFKEYHFQSGDLLFVGKDETHAWKNFKNIEGYIFLFTQDFIYENHLQFKDLSYSYPYNSFLYNPKIEIKNEQDLTSLHSLVNHIEDEYVATNQPFKKEIIQCLLRVFFLKIRSQINKEPEFLVKGKSALFIQFQKAIDENVSITRNVNDYCKMLDVTYKDLNNLCKTLTDKTAKSVLDEVIIQKAKKFLLDPDKNINITSYLLGFEESTNFTKFFKKYEKMNPKEFIAKFST